MRRPSIALALAAFVLAACASKPPDNPDARACLPPATPALRSADYALRLAAYTQRADAFAACMQERGYVLDEQELDARLLRFEQVKYANRLSGDPLWAKRILRQELRTDAALWRRG